MQSFALEADLVSKVLSAIREAHRREWKTVLELDANVGVADVVLFLRNQRTTGALKALSCLGPRLAPILDPSVARSVTSFDQFCSLLGCSSVTARSYSKILHEVGYVHEGASGFFIKPILAPPFEKIIAIEAKLRNWQSALSQAYRNKQFADQSWVVLDHACHISAVRNLEKFLRAGVGLTSLTVGGELHIHSMAASNLDFSRQKRWAAQAAIARRLLAQP